MAVNLAVLVITLQVGSEMEFCPVFFAAVKVPSYRRKAAPAALHCPAAAQQNSEVVAHPAAAWAALGLSASALFCSLQLLCIKTSSPTLLRLGDFVNLGCAPEVV